MGAQIHFCMCVCLLLCCTWCLTCASTQSPVTHFDLAMHLSRLHTRSWGTGTESVGLRMCEGQGTAVGCVGRKMCGGQGIAVGLVGLEMCG